MTAVALEEARVEAALVGVPPGARVLDVPCGDGAWSSLLARLGYRVTAADPVEATLGAARERVAAELAALGLPPRVEFVRRDPLHLDFPPASFDAVVSASVLPPLADAATRQDALRELARVSRGPVVVRFLSSATLASAARRLLRRPRPAGGHEIHPGTLGRDAEAAGLEVRRLLPVRYGLRPETWVSLSRPGTGRG